MANNFKVINKYSSDKDIISNLNIEKGEIFINTNTETPSILFTNSNGDICSVQDTTSLKSDFKGLQKKVKEASNDALSAKQVVDNFSGDIESLRKNVKCLRDNKVSQSVFNEFKENIPTKAELEQNLNAYISMEAFNTFIKNNIEITHTYLQGGIDSNKEDIELINKNYINEGQAKSITIETIQSLLGASSSNQIETIRQLLDAVNENGSLVGQLNKDIKNKVDKEEGKGLSSNDFTNSDKEKLNSLQAFTLLPATSTTLGGVKVGDNLTIDSNSKLNALNTDTKVTSADNHYVPSEDTTQELNAQATTTTDITTNEVEVVTGLQRDKCGHIVGLISKKITAPKQEIIQSDWAATNGEAVILNKPSLSKVATSGSYNDLSNQPTILKTGYSKTNNNYPIQADGDSKLYVNLYDIINSQNSDHEAITSTSKQIDELDSKIDTTKKDLNDIGTELSSFKTSVIQNIADLNTSLKTKATKEEIKPVIVAINTVLDDLSKLFTNVDLVVKSELFDNTVINFYNFIKKSQGTDTIDIYVLYRTNENISTPICAKAIAYGDLGAGVATVTFEDLDHNEWTLTSGNGSDWQINKKNGSVQVATEDTVGTIKLGSNVIRAGEINKAITGIGENNRNYPLQLNHDKQACVYVPWIDYSEEIDSVREHSWPYVIQLSAYISSNSSINNEDVSFTVKAPEGEFTEGNELYNWLKTSDSRLSETWYIAYPTFREVTTPGRPPISPQLMFSNVISMGYTSVIGGVQITFIDCWGVTRKLLSIDNGDTWQLTTKESDNIDIIIELNDDLIPPFSATQDGINKILINGESSSLKNLCEVIADNSSNKENLNINIFADDGADLYTQYKVNKIESDWQGDLVVSLYCGNIIFTLMTETDEIDGVDNTNNTLYFKESTSLNQFKNTLTRINSKYELDIFAWVTIDFDGDQWYDSFIGEQEIDENRMYKIHMHGLYNNSNNLELIGTLMQNTLKPNYYIPVSSFTAYIRNMEDSKLNLEISEPLHFISGSTIISCPIEKMSITEIIQGTLRKFN